MKNSKKTTLLVCGLLLFNLWSTAATFTSAKSGNWKSANAWLEDGKPGPNDDIIIQSGHVIQLNGSAYTHQGDITILEGGELIANTGNNVKGFTFDGNAFHVFGTLTLPFPEKDLSIVGNSQFWGHPSALIFISDDWIVKDNAEVIVEGICVEVDDDFHLEGTQASVCGGGGISIGNESNKNTFNLLDGATTAQVCVKTNVYRGKDGNCTTLVGSGTGNKEPNAINDQANTIKNNAITINILHLGTADNDPDLGDRLQIFSLGNDLLKSDQRTEAGGHISINDNGSPNDPSDDFVDYSPPADFVGTDQFQYIITDQNGAYTYATVTISVGDALPVSLVGFDAQGKDCNIQLSWTTANELNNEYFDIERSTDGQNFSYLATIEGAGTSTITQTYEWTDSNPEPANYYRLKQVDFDGQFTYSNIIFSTSHCVQQKKDIEALTLFPNPVFDEEVQLRFIAGVQSQVPLLLSDLTGKILIRRIATVEAGNNQLSIDIQQLPAGTYFLFFGQQSKQFVKG